MEGVQFMDERCRPGEIRDAIVGFLAERKSGASVAEIRTAVAAKIKAMAPSSVRSYLRLNAGTMFDRTERGSYVLSEVAGGKTVAQDAKPKSWKPVFEVGKSELYEGDCIEWLRQREERSIHGVVTD